MKSQARLSVRSINQSNRSISVRLLFLFCSRAFISRSDENRSTSSFDTTSSTEIYVKVSITSNLVCTDIKTFGVNILLTLSHVRETVYTSTE